MNEHTTKSSPGSGRTALWVVLALALAALAYLTLGLAIPNNPLYSDRDANGISKYRFLEHCQEQIEASPEMEQIRSALVSQNMLGADDGIYSDIALKSPELVERISVSNQPGQSWMMAVPVQIRSELTHQPLLNIYSQCYYDTGAGQTVVTLQPTQ